MSAFDIHTPAEHQGTRGVQSLNFSPNAFFDIPEGSAGGLFEGVEYVWEAVAALPGYIEAIIEPGVKGDIEEGAWLEPGVVQLDEGCRVERGAIVRGPTIIGRDTVIRSGAYIRGHVMVGQGCVLGHGVELRQMLALDRTSIPHTSCVFTSLLGNRVRFAGVAQTANFLLTGEDIAIRVKDGKRTRHYPTGLSKLGAIIGDDSNIGALSLLNPGTIIGRRCTIYPQSSVTGYTPDDSKVYPRRYTGAGESA